MDRQLGYAAALESFFRERWSDSYLTVAEDLWNRDYSSVSAYLHSVEERRAAWKDLLAPPNLGSIHRRTERGSKIDGGTWLKIDLDHGLSAEGLLVGDPQETPLVVFQHGLGSLPERVFGLDDPEDTYGGVGALLVDAGYSVLAPMNLIGIERRNRAQALAKLAGTTVEGLEFSRLQVLLDSLNVTRYALAGMSWGGLAAQYWSPLDDRVQAVASLGYFNDRPKKMMVQDARYVTFADTGEHHAFLHGLLQGFGDADLASLVAPKPMYVAHGRADLIGWWPQVEAEAERAKAHWSRLGMDGNFTFELHEGGHVIAAPPLVEWLTTHYPV